MDQNGNTSSQQEITRLRRIGYWRGDSDTRWPDVRQFIDTGWDSDERSSVAWYLNAGLFARGYMGYSTCRLCGKRNGNIEFTDGVYIWPQGLAHYVEEHGVRLPHEFVEHAQEMTGRWEEAEVEEEWWASKRSW